MKNRVMKNKQDFILKVENEGFFGVAVREGEEYRFSVWSRVPDGGEAKLKVVIVDTKSQGESQEIAKARVTVDSKEWKKYTAVLKPKMTEAKGKLRIFLERPETTVDLEHVSLFPVDTWKGHENGLRRDLAQKLADLKPGISVSRADASWRARKSVTATSGRTL